MLKFVLVLLVIFVKICPHVTHFNLIFHLNLLSLNSYNGEQVMKHQHWFEFVKPKRRVLHHFILDYHLLYFYCAIIACHLGLNSLLGKPLLTQSAQENRANNVHLERRRAPPYLPAVLQLRGKGKIPNRKRKNAICHNLSNIRTANAT